MTVKPLKNSRGLNLTPVRTASIFALGTGEGGVVLTPPSRDYSAASVAAAGNTSNRFARGRSRGRSSRPDNRELPSEYRRLALVAFLP